MKINYQIIMKNNKKLQDQIFKRGQVYNYNKFINQYKM